MKRWIRAATKLKKKDMADMYAKYMTEHYDRPELEKYKSEISQIAQIAGVSYDALTDALLNVIFDSYYAFAIRSDVFEIDFMQAYIPEMSESEAIEYIINKPSSQYSQYSKGIFNEMYVDVYGVVRCELSSANAWTTTSANRYYQLVDSKYVDIGKIRLHEYLTSRYSSKRCAAYLEIDSSNGIVDFNNYTSLN